MKTSIIFLLVLYFYLTLSQKSSTQPSSTQNSNPSASPTSPILPTSLNTKNQCFTNLLQSTGTKSLTILSNTAPNMKFISSVQYNVKYQEYLNQHKPDEKPTQSSSEWTYRQLTYTRNLQNINSYNKNATRRYNKGLNKFTDLPEKQFLAIYAKLKLPSTISQLKTVAKIPTLPKKSPDINTTTKTVSNVNVKDTIVGSETTYSKTRMLLTTPTTPQNISIDWTCKATPVLNQGQCGSCYIIAPLQAVIMTYKIYDVPILPLSIQQILSCGFTNNAINNCEGGYFNAAYDYIQVNGTGRAIMYPYDSRAINQGFVKPCNSVVMDNPLYKSSRTFIISSNFIPSGDCAVLVQQLKKSAISVSISAQGLQFYLNGTFNSVSQVINHGVTLVGYDPDNEYKIKNSWGTSWGNSGYAYVSQSVGICDYAMYPITGAQKQNTGSCC